jgi:hypothetical protein
LYVASQLVWMQSLYGFMSASVHLEPASPLPVLLHCVKLPPLDVAAPLEVPLPLDVPVPPDVALPLDVPVPELPLEEELLLAASEVQAMMARAVTPEAKPKTRILRIMRTLSRS